MTKFRVESVNDGNVSFEIEAVNRKEAYREALIQLGYCLFEIAEEDKESPRIKIFNPQPKPMKGKK